MKNKLKEALKKWKWLQKTVSCIKWHPRRVSSGQDNPDKTCYIIRRHDLHAGLFSFVSTNLGVIRKAVDAGYIPVIDMAGSPNSMLTQQEVGHKNAWEDYFEQPCGYTMQDITSSRNVILGTIDPPEDYPDFRMIEQPQDISGWQQYASRYLRLRTEHQDAVNAYISEHFGTDRVLGVLCRGTDYITLKPHNHPVQPQTADVIEKCREVMQNRNCRYLYLATEDADIWDAFTKAFPGKVYSYQKERYRTDQTDGYLDSVGNSKMNPYERNRDYLISIGILAKCTCLVAGAANGTYGALLLTKGYEYTYIYQLGRYE